MKRNIYTTSAKDYYDNAPMMDMSLFRTARTLS